MRRRFIALSLAVTSVLGPVAGATAGTILVDLEGQAVRIESGQAVLVLVTVTCPAGEEVLEALVTVSQPQASGMGGFPLRCTGRARTYAVRVASFGQPFEPGPAQVSAFVLLLDPATGTTESGSASETIEIR